MDRGLLAHQSQKARMTYPGRVPVYCTPHLHQTNTNESKNKKFMVPSDMTVSEFQLVLRRKMELSPCQAMFLFAGNIIPAGTMTFKELDALHRSTDTGMVHITWAFENTFGRVSLLG